LTDSTTDIREHMQIPAQN